MSSCQVAFEKPRGKHALLKGFLVFLTAIWNQNQSRYIKILSLKNYLSRISQSDLGLAS